MGRGVPDSHQELAGELGKAQCLFPVFRAHTAHHLHYQHRGGLSPPATQGDQEQGGASRTTPSSKSLYSLPLRESGGNGRSPSRTGAK